MAGNPFGRLLYHSRDLVWSVVAVLAFAATWPKRWLTTPGVVTVAEPCRIERITGVAVPDTVPLSRYEPVPVELRHPEHDARVDAKSLFYDVFWDGRQLVMIGPPLRNFEALIRLDTIRIDGERPSRAPVLRQMHGCQITTLALPTRPQQIKFELDWPTEAALVQPSGFDLFRGRKVITTKSRDNRLDWIADWVDFHVRAHGVDAVLFYDNNSTLYSPDELLARIRTVPGVDVAVVVPWSHKWGYWNKHISADYTQVTILEHARRRFLRDARGILSCDVDEMVVSKGGRSLFDWLDQSLRGAIHFHGTNIESVTPPTAPLRHRDLSYGSGKSSPDKWAAIPRLMPDKVQWHIHGAGGRSRSTRARDLTFRHFIPITTKSERVQHEYDPTQHQLDTGWLRAMEHVGWRRPEDPSPGQPPSGQPPGSAS
ncbi:MAG: hypothetical protein ABL879_15280 [Devosia sp.]